MKHEKGIILIVILISVTILCGYNYLTVNKEDEHQSYDLGIITMNSTNTSNLVCKVNETGFLRYGDDSGRFTLTIISYDNMTSSKAMEYKIMMHNYRQSPSRDVDGIVVYTTTANIGEYVGETRYGAIIENQDLNVDVDICTPDINETVYIAKNTKFN